MALMPRSAKSGRWVRAEVKVPGEPSGWVEKVGNV